MFHVKHLFICKLFLNLFLKHEVSLRPFSAHHWISSANSRSLFAFLLFLYACITINFSYFNVNHKLYLSPIVCCEEHREKENRIDFHLYSNAITFYGMLATSLIPNKKLGIYFTLRLHRYCLFNSVTGHAPGFYLKELELALELSGHE